MVLDPIPQILPVHFFGSRPQPPTSPDTCICICIHAYLWMMASLRARLWMMALLRAQSIYVYTCLCVHVCLYWVCVSLCALIFTCTYYVWVYIAIYSRIRSKNISQYISNILGCILVMYANIHWYGTSQYIFFQRMHTLTRTRTPVNIDSQTKLKKNRCSSASRPCSWLLPAIHRYAGWENTCMRSYDVGCPNTWIQSCACSWHPLAIHKYGGWENTCMQSCDVGCENT